jgi:precorrin-8X/cobalt-precorrin-8 methylmutase
VTRTVHPIEAESYAILRSRTDTSTLSPLTRAVVERVIHASADLDYRDDLVLDEGALEAAVAALEAGAPIVCDVEMVAAGITRAKARSWLNSPHIPHIAREHGITRSAAGIRIALTEVGPGAVWVVGCAPTALFQLIELGDAAAPALVIGLPVGFVGAAESKAALRESGLPAVSNRSEKGGSAVAAAALNALLYS